jgi:replication-associated recombination protein RarA
MCRLDRCNLARHAVDVLVRSCSISHDTVDGDAVNPAAGRGDDALVDKVLTQLLRTLPPPARDQTDLQMGIAEHVQQLQATMAGRDVGIVGLHGMGGIGKTTLAKAFYAEQCNLPIFQRRVLLHVGQEAKDAILQARCTDPSLDRDVH